MIKLFVGLGNPGTEYEGTRHNVGFWWVDALARELKLTLSMDRGYHGLVARTSLHGRTVWLLEPQTFMNLSGKSVAALARFFKIAPDEILVIHDELDIAPGQAKLKFGGSHAGHNGLRDIHAQLGTDDYWRLRLGIGHPGVKAEVVNWVLKKPAPEQRTAIEECIARTLKAVQPLMAGEMEKATLLVHTSKPPGRSRRVPKGWHPRQPPHRRRRPTMNTKLPIALLCAALAGWMPAAGAQAIYRCGDSYSQKPCPGGKLVETDDARSSGQKAQTDQAVRRDAKAADELEKARLKEEAKPAQLVMPPEKPQEPARPVATSTMKKPEHSRPSRPRKPGDTVKKKKKAKKKDA